MKDYYYILGIQQNASEEEIKKSYRKLSLKFHPDKNDGDSFFTERFREINEAYETLIDTAKRNNYDNSRTNSYSHQYNNRTNFTPEIEQFKSNKISFEYGEEVTFSWKTINADKVFLRPFGVVSPIGNKTYKIKDFKNKYLSFELVAENTTINRQISAKVNLTNRTYEELLLFFTKEVNLKRAENDQSFSATQETNYGSKEFLRFLGWGALVIVCIFILMYFLTEGK